MNPLPERMLIISATMLLLCVMATKTSFASFELNFSPYQNTSYDDNVLLQNEDKKSDTVSLTGLSTGLESEGYFHNVSINYRGESEKFSENAQLNNIKHYADLRAEIELSPYTLLEVTNNFLSRKDFNFSYLGLDTLPLTSIIRLRRDTNDFMLRINRNITGRTSIRLDYNQHYKNVEIENEVDEDIDTFQAGLNYLFGRQNRHKFHLVLERKDYSFHENNTLGKDRGFIVHSLTAGSLFDIFSSEVNIYGGVAKTEEKDSISLSDEEYLFMGGITYKHRYKYMETGFSYKYGMYGKGIFGELITRDSVKVEINYHFTPHIYLTSSCKYRKNDYSGANILGSEKDNTSLILNTELEYKTEHENRVSIFYSLFKSDYMLPEASGISDYEQSLIGIEAEFHITKYLTLNIKYQKTQRESEGDTSGNISFKRNLISANVVLTNFDFGN